MRRHRPADKDRPGRARHGLDAGRGHSGEALRLVANVVHPDCPERAGRCPERAGRERHPDHRRHVQYARTAGVPGALLNVDVPVLEDAEGVLVRRGARHELAGRAGSPGARQRLGRRARDRARLGGGDDGRGRGGRRRRGGRRGGRREGCRWLPARRARAWRRGAAAGKGRHEQETDRVPHAGAMVRTPAGPVQGALAVWSPCDETSASTCVTSPNPKIVVNGPHEVVIAWAQWRCPVGPPSSTRLGGHLVASRDPVRGSQQRGRSIGRLEAHPGASMPPCGRRAIRHAITG